LTAVSCRKFVIVSGTVFNALQGRIQAIEASAANDLAASRSERNALRKECGARDEELKALKDMLRDAKQVSFVSTKPMSECLN
jgi:hypothetical protein